MINKIGEKSLNERTITIIYISVAVIYLAVILIWGITISPDKYSINYSEQFMSPSINHIFGTDFMGRDMFYRCLKGLSNSLIIALTSSVISSIIGLVLGTMSGSLGGLFDKFVLMCIDCCMGLPHLVLLILISCMLGKGERGVLVSVAITHWPEITRLVRAEVLQVKSCDYIKVANKMGISNLNIAISHIIPHVIPTYIVSLIMTFPHAIMHESAITFLGFGFDAETPAIGIILSESMKHISTGKWWLAIFPGIMLVATVLLFYIIGTNIKNMMNPLRGHI